MALRTTGAVTIMPAGAVGVLRRWDLKGGLPVGVALQHRQFLGRPSRIRRRVESSEVPDTMMHSPTVESSDESVESSEFLTQRINGLVELSRGKQRGN
jgi:hypothetical protein